MPITIDESRWPLVAVELTGRLTAADVHAFLTGGDRWLGARRPYGILFIPRTMGAPSIAELKPLFRWMDDNQAQLHRYYRVMAVVTQSAALRGALRGILKIKPIAADQFVTSDIDEAIGWALAALGGRADSPPP